MLFRGTSYNRTLTPEEQAELDTLDDAYSEAFEGYQETNSEADRLKASQAGAAYRAAISRIKGVSHA